MNYFNIPQMFGTYPVEMFAIFVTLAWYLFETIHVLISNRIFVALIGYAGALLLCVIHYSFIGYLVVLGIGCIFTLTRYLVWFQIWHNDIIQRTALNDRIFNLQMASASRARHLSDALLFEKRRFYAYAASMIVLLLLWPIAVGYALSRLPIVI